MKRVYGLSFVVIYLIFALPALAQHTDAEEMTPLLLTVHDAPIPFTGSDGRTHLVYELWLANFSSSDISVEKAQVLGDGALLQTQDAPTVARRLQAAGQRESSATLLKGTQALLFLNIVLAADGHTPSQLSHRLMVHVAAAPVGHQEFTVIGGETKVDLRDVVRIGPPILGERFISADSCCDATRHTRAALPINGHVWLAQRFAVDWEQLDADNRIYVGPRQTLQSYTIFGKSAVAVTDAVVESITDGLPEQTPGKYPTNIQLDQADGNSVILNLGQHRYAMYAHLQPGTIRVHRGEAVKRGQVLGLVGNTGNSLAPHLHFQVMDGPSSLASNGLPYEIEQFQVTGETPGTEAFDEAESNGTPLKITPIVPLRSVKDALPLDQQIISFSKTF